jgi:hypothetical protein
MCIQCLVQHVIYRSSLILAQAVFGGIVDGPARYEANDIIRDRVGYPSSRIPEYGAGGRETENRQEVRSNR